MDAKEIAAQVSGAIEEILNTAPLKRGSLFVIGCSSSEILGEHIGKFSSLEAASAVYQGASTALQSKGLYLAAQCCEHLNRAVVLEEEAAEKYGYEPVSVRPQIKAGGGFATVAYESMSSPVVVETVRAHAGIDIGGTLIGMHLKWVAVPLRVSISKIGKANLVCAYTRPKLIGGQRAKYL